jgi:neutral ceramidase
MTLRAGAAVRDISPTQPMALYGYPHVARVSTGIHDPLLASALFLENDGNALMLVALDLLFLDPPVARTIRKRVAEFLKIPESGVFISCTHTHSGPVTRGPMSEGQDILGRKPDPAYLARLGDEVVKAATAAATAAVPAAVSWTSADARGVGGNRLSADGVTDPECGILAVRRADTQSILAVSLIYGMHPTVLHEDSTLVSSDFPHYTRVHLREQFGEGVTVLYHTAPCGNQSPRYFVKSQTFDEAERLGRKLGVVAAASLAGIPESSWSTSPRLDGILTPVDLPRRPLMPLEAAQARLDEYRATFERLKAEGAPHPEVRTAECAIFGAEGGVALAKSEAAGDIARMVADYAPLEVQLIRIGEVDVVGIPGECFTEYALAIKHGAKTKTFVVSLVNGELRGYVVTPEALAAGGYEATSAVFDPAAGSVLVKTALALGERVASLRAEKG